MSEQRQQDFDQRFQEVVKRMRFTRVLTVLGWTGLALTFALIILACLDYMLETNWTFRAVIVGCACLASACVAQIVESASSLVKIQLWSAQF